MTAGLEWLKSSESSPFFAGSAQLTSDLFGEGLLLAPGPVISGFRLTPVGVYP